MSVHRGGKSEGKEITHSLPFLMYSAPGGLRQDPGHVAELSAEARTYGNDRFAKYVCPGRRMGLAGRRTSAGLAVRLRGLDAQMPMSSLPDRVEQLAEMQPC